MHVVVLGYFVELQLRTVRSVSVSFARVATDVCDFLRRLCSNVFGADRRMVFLGGGFHGENEYIPVCVPFDSAFPNTTRGLRARGFWILFRPSNRSNLSTTRLGSRAPTWLLRNFRRFARHPAVRPLRATGSCPWRRLYCSQNVSRPRFPVRQTKQVTTSIIGVYTPLLQCCFVCRSGATSSRETVHSESVIHLVHPIFTFAVTDASVRRIGRQNQHEVFWPFYVLL